MVLLAVFLLLIFSVPCRITDFSHCLFVDSEKLGMSKKLRFSMMTIKKYNMVYSLSIMVFQLKWSYI